MPRNPHPLPKVSAKTCLLASCGKTFTPVMGGVSGERQKFHSQKCRQEYHDQRRLQVSPSLNASSTSIGAARELIVAADLLKMGFAVYRTLSGAHVDLLVIRGKHVWRVEVTTAQRSYSDGLVRCPSDKKRQTHKFDVLAMVESDNTIIYLPTNWLDSEAPSAFDSLLLEPGSKI